MIIQNVYILHIIIFQNIGDIDMDFGDAQKECIDKGSETATLKGAENSPSFSKQNDVEAVISHKKPKKDGNPFWSSASSEASKFKFEISSKFIFLHFKKF
jgi:hypothetical protein